MKILPTVLASILPVLAACSATAPDPTKPPAAVSASGPLFFTAPEVVADEATTLLKAEDWKTLARYYDLAGSDVKRADLDTGVYFKPAPPKDAPPGPRGAMQGRQPFAPGFRFDSVEKTNDPAVVRINLIQVIDQGGGMKQRVRTFCLVRQSAAGWQLLPRNADAR